MEFDTLESFLENENPYKLADSLPNRPESTLASRISMPSYKIKENYNGHSDSFTDFKFDDENCEEASLILNHPADIKDYL